VGQIDQLEQLVNRSSACSHLYIVARPEEIEIFPNGHVVVDTEKIWHVANQAADCGWILPHGLSGDKYVSGGGLEQGRHHPDGSRLSGAVRADEAEDVAVLNRK
jgi:hypothetical protein